MAVINSLVNFSRWHRRRACGERGPPRGRWRARGASCRGRRRRTGRAGCRPRRVAPRRRARGVCEAVGRADDEGAERVTPVEVDAPAFGQPRHAVGPPPTRRSAVELHRAPASSRFARLDPPHLERRHRHRAASSTRSGGFVHQVGQNRFQPILGEAVGCCDAKAVSVDVDERGVLEPGLVVGRGQRHLELTEGCSPDLLRVHRWQRDPYFTRLPRPPRLTVRHPGEARSTSHWKEPFRPPSGLSRRGLSLGTRAIRRGARAAYVSTGFRGRATSVRYTPGGYIGSGRGACQQRAPSVMRAQAVGVSRPICRWLCAPPRRQMTTPLPIRPYRTRSLRR